MEKRLKMEEEELERKKMNEKIELESMTFEEEAEMKIN